MPPVRGAVSTSTPPRAASAASGKRCCATSMVAEERGRAAAGHRHQPRGLVGPGRQAAARGGGGRLQRGRTGLLRRGRDAVGGRRHALRSTIEGCDRAARLIDQLLLLARLESGTAPELAMLDLADVTRRVLAEATPDALIKGQHLELDAPEHFPALGSIDLLRVLARNLVDNAIRYSPKGAWRLSLNAVSWRSRRLGRDGLPANNG